MTDYPPGKWSDLLVGAWWLSSLSTNLAVVSQGKRTAASAEYDSYEHRLMQARTGPLAQQEGVTAEATKDAFAKGERLAKDIADKNGVKATAYGEASHALEALRSQLWGPPSAETKKSKTFRTTH